MIWLQETTEAMTETKYDEIRGFDSVDIDGVGRTLKYENRLCVTNDMMAIIRRIESEDTYHTQVVIGQTLVGSIHIPSAHSTQRSKNLDQIHTKWNAKQVVLAADVNRHVNKAQHTYNVDRIGMSVYKKSTHTWSNCTVGDKSVTNTSWIDYILVCKNMGCNTTHDAVIHVIHAQTIHRSGFEWMQALSVDVEWTHTLTMGIG